jgi:DNA-directed RNA polymerase specialized sigma24 family protein
MGLGFYAERRDLIERAIAHAARLLRLQPFDADDFTQDARIHCFEHDEPLARGLQRSDEPEAYLYRVFHNFALNWWRTRSRMTRHYVDLDPADLETRASIRDSAAVRLVHRDEARKFMRRIRLVDDAIAGLSGPDLLLLAAWLSSDSLDWWALVRGTSRAAIYSRIYRVLHALRATLESDRGQQPLKRKGGESALRRLMELVEMPKIGRRQDPERGSSRARRAG